MPPASAAPRAAPTQSPLAEGGRRRQARPTQAASNGHNGRNSPWLPSPPATHRCATRPGTTPRQTPATPPGRARPAGPAPAPRRAAPAPRAPTAPPPAGPRNRSRAPPAATPGTRPAARYGGGGEKTSTENGVPKRGHSLQRCLAGPKRSLQGPDQQAAGRRQKRAGSAPRWLGVVKKAGKFSPLARVKSAWVRLRQESEVKEIPSRRTGLSPVIAAEILCWAMVSTVAIRIPSCSI